MQQGLPQLDFGQAVQLSLSRISDMNGRSRRSEFWWTMLAMMIPFFIIWIINRGMMSVAGSVIMSLLGAAVWLASVPLQCRRMHDTGRGNTLVFALAAVYILQLLCTIIWVAQVSKNPFAALDSSMGTLVGLCALVYFVLCIICIVFWAQDSQRGTNQWGPSPKYPDGPANPQPMNGPQVPPQAPPQMPQNPPQMPQDPPQVP